PGLLEVLRRDLAMDIDAGRFGQGLQRRVLSRFRYLDGVNLTPIKSLLVIAVPRPAHLISLETPCGREHTVRLPPTYIGIRATARATLDAALSGPLSGASGAVLAEIPLKAVAVRLGLAAYGRNNVCYVPGLGSYHQLVAILTDAPVQGLTARLGPVHAAAGCDGCGACMERCPTGAITGDRFPIDAERCLSRLNERPGVWPDWLPPEAHNCLFGCLACQENCPQNAGLLSYEDTGVRLDVAETAAILARSEAEATPSLDPNEGSPANGSPDEEAWQAAVSKLGAIGLDHCRAVLGRNLRALLGLEVAVCGDYQSPSAQ
ncbi:MAG: 4Fe-4S double cluster binding domain-containing protein, partial [Bacillota bacterium]|nr:4Fe-4S double cluster binding domain-containing protein [Bacillota bacterium]